jgi:Raf kinase inhibitor-like YbhB/YbcL family protein
MWLESTSFPDGGVIPEEFVFGVPDSEAHVTFGPNRNPHLAWGDLPAETQSVFVTCVDGDVPTVADDVNQENREVPADLPRADFVHWVIVDLPVQPGEIAAGEFSSEVTPRGKDGSGPRGRQGVNDYTSWFSGDPDMDGTYLGYDGPCPPWNDARVHRYQFTVVALDIASLPVDDGFTVEDVRRVADGHILGSATITGSYSLNPQLRG